MDLCNLYDFYTFVFTLAFTPCTFNVLFYVRIKYYNNNRQLQEPANIPGSRGYDLVAYGETFGI